MGKDVCERVFFFYRCWQKAWSWLSLMAYISSFVTFVWNCSFKSIKKFHSSGIEGWTSKGIKFHSHQSPCSIEPFFLPLLFQSFNLFHQFLSISIPNSVPGISRSWKFDKFFIFRHIRYILYLKLICLCVEYFFFFRICLSSFFSW